ncbi:hypothetical protein AXF42_Ash015232 [Apostasia shenzhenica]|uniref:Uncharacterized protein n=1 Tax=Apostasia shenzhenica TaxID=1088818 RepID=A0A2I0AQN7_9ASPA|nr:hypothetical protein AXF42_Ash015232 [Apostasia shenzhenica]
MLFSFSHGKACLLGLWSIQLVQSAASASCLTIYRESGSCRRQASMAIEPNPDMEVLSRQEESSNVGRLLFKKAMTGEWDEVVNIYQKNPSARKAKVTRAQHTVLHLAVSEGNDRIVEQLFQTMEDSEAVEILGLQNEFGDTALHVAAALGLERICILLTEREECKELVVNARNNARETPLYVAAHHGKKKAFFVLQDCVSEHRISELKDQDSFDRRGDLISFCRRGDGNTVLHAAILGEYFGNVFSSHTSHCCHHYAASYFT